MNDSSTYKIEKLRLAIAVRLRGRSVLQGFVFSQPLPYGGHEEVVDILNGEEAFFPLLSRAGATMLVSKNNVVEAVPEAAAEIDELRRVSARPAKVEIVMEDGTRRRGVIFIEMPHERPRVLDFLNSSSDRFFTLYAGGSVSLINRYAIASVHPLD